MAKKSVAEYAADMDITLDGNVEQAITDLESYISESTELEMMIGANALKKHAEAQAALEAAAPEAEAQ